MKRKILAGIMIGVGLTAYAIHGYMYPVMAEDINIQAADDEADGTIDEFAHPVTSLDELGLTMVGADGASSASYRSPYITSVKSQRPYGTCWAFAGAAAIEAELQKEGLAGSSIDLSEWQMAYYAYHTASDPLGLTSGDTISLSDYLNKGGNQYILTASLANWKGVVTETAAPYETIVSNASATMSESLAYQSDLYHLENAYWISASDRNQVKQAIVNYGAVATSFYSNDYFLNSSTGGYYCPVGYTYNHGITIIGWDDNYSTTNYGTYRPSSNGAWLCKNSYGTDWGLDGYFWLSYEDAGMDKNVYAYDLAPADNYTYNYQYDGTPAMTRGNEQTTTVYTANVFTATGNQVLQAVGYYSFDTLYKTVVSIYKNPVSNADPTSGTLMTTQTVTDTFAGYHTLTLSSPVNLQKGDRFAIVLKQSTPDGKYAYYYVDYTYSDIGMQMVSSASAGQSYVSGSGSSWDDIGQSESANLRIKAFTVNSNKSSTEINAEAFAARLYNLCLGRTPDASGLEHWTSVLTNKERSGAAVAYGFVFSKEYMARNTSNADYVTMLYSVFLNRTPDSEGYQHWIQYLEQGLSREYVFRGFAQSQEFTNICNSYGIERGSVTLTQARDQNPNLTAYVNRMYVCALGRQGEEDGLNHWCRTITQKVRTPEQVAEAFILSAEFKQKNLSDEEYVKVLYRTFLGREYDSEGLAHWIGELNRGCSRENILHRFATSKEFKGIQEKFGV